ncbi:MAG: arylsulfotransferase family protein [Albidovulum sp.]
MIPRWMTLLGIGLAPAAFAIYGHLLLGAVRSGGEGQVATAVLALAEAPKTTVDLLKGRDLDPRHVAHPERFTDPAGWTVAPGGATELAAEGYLLLSRYSGDEDRAVVELVDLSGPRTLHVWRPSAETVFAGLPAQASLTRISQWGPFSRWNQRYFEMVHPFLMENGDLVIKDHGTPLVRIDLCGALVWRQAEDMFKHSTNRDAEGMFWVSSVIEPHDPAFGPQFAEDALVRIDPADGRVLERISTVPLLDEAGYFPQMFGAGAARNDPIHMNDIQPVLADGPFWQKGDLFLSMRNLSLVALYRPSEGRLVWSRQGPWMAQHDVDLLDDHRIAVFSNNAYDAGYGDYVRGANEVFVYDFATGEVSSPWRAALQALHVNPRSDGLFDFTAAGNLVIEDENNGRILILGPDGRLLASYLNRARDGSIFTMGWSRVVERSVAESAIAAVAARGDCAG